VWPVPLAQVLPRPQLIFPSKPGFLEFISIFSGRSHFKTWIQILPNKFHYILLINIFPTTPKAHSNSCQIFSYDLIWFLVKKSFNIQELLHCKSKRHGTKPMHPPSSSRAFQRDQERNVKHPGSVDLISTNKTKQTNYLPSLIDNHRAWRDAVHVDQSCACDELGTKRIWSLSSMETSRGLIALLKLTPSLKQLPTNTELAI
jgi:hypothetical protein